MTRLYIVTARDPKTYRTMRRGVASAAVEGRNPPWFLPALLEEIAASIARGWAPRYRVPFPTDRIEWTAGPEPDRRLLA